MAEPPPRLAGVLETALYHDSAVAEEMLRLYRDLLGLPVVAGWPGGKALRLGAGVVLLFDREKLAERGGPISDHGATGAGHACFLAAAGDYERWRAALAEAGVDVHHEQDWDGARSLYFRDPAGNLLEIAEADLWPAAP